MRRTRYLLISFILAAAPAAAQQWDPDRCLTCHDSQLHFVAGASIDVAAHIILPKTTIWQRLAVVATIALAYELGQESATRTAGIHGPGYGLGPKDWALTVAGGAVLEGAWSLGRRIFR